MHVEPEAHAVGPVQPWPPHWPYLLSEGISMLFASYIVKELTSEKHSQSWLSLKLLAEWWCLAL